MSRLIKIEPNPFKSKKRFKLRSVRITDGKPVVGPDGKPITSIETPENVTRIPGTETTLSPALGKNGLLMTGLDIIVENPYKDGDTDKAGYWSQAWGEQIFKDRKHVKLQHVLEYKHKQPYDHYTNKISLEPKSSMDSNRTFFETPGSRMILKDNITVLDMNNPIHEVWYYMAKSHPLIANSYSDIQNGDAPFAEWFIADDDVKDEAKASRIEKETQSAAALQDLLSNYESGLLVVAKALKLDDVATISKQALTATVYGYYNENEDNRLKFMYMYDRWKNQATRNEVVGLATLSDYIRHATVLERTGGVCVWIKRDSSGNNTEYLRNSREDFVKTFMLNPLFSDEANLLHEEYEAKTKV